MSHVALVNGSSLLGRELRERLDLERGLVHRLDLLTTREEEVGTVSEALGGAALVRRWDPSEVAGADLVFLLGPAAELEEPLQSLPADARAIVLSPDAPADLGVPLVEGVNLDGLDPTARVLVSPPAPAIQLAHLLAPLAGFGPTEATATVLQPVSRLAGEPLDDLLQQTRSMLSFQPLSGEGALDRQTAFNVFPTVEAARLVPDHLAMVLGGRACPISTQLVQAGVFHSQSVSLHVTLETDPGVDGMMEALAGHPLLHLLDPGDEEPGPIDAAASEEVLLGTVVPDAGRPGSYWLWSVMDNLTRGGALNALAIARTVLR